MTVPPQSRRRLTEREVRRILRLHTTDGLPAAVIARRLGIHENTVYKILWGHTHRGVTQGRNVSAAQGRLDQRRDEIMRVYTETGSKSATARRLGVSRPTVHYHVSKGGAA